MYAPILITWDGIVRWHRVNPRNLIHPVCNSASVIDANQIRDDLPDDAVYCNNCRVRHGALYLSSGQGLPRSP